MYICIAIRYFLFFFRVLFFVSLRFSGFQRGDKDKKCEKRMVAGVFSVNEAIDFLMEIYDNEEDRFRCFFMYFLLM